MAAGFEDRVRANKIKAQDAQDALRRQKTEISNDSGIIGAQKVTEDIMERIKREAAIVAGQGPLDKDDIRTKIEWQARQILTR